MPSRPQPLDVYTHYYDRHCVWLDFPRMPTIQWTSLPQPVHPRKWCRHILMPQHKQYLSALPRYRERFLIYDHEGKTPRTQVLRTARLDLVLTYGIPPNKLVIDHASTKGHLSGIYFLRGCFWMNRRKFWLSSLSSFRFFFISPESNLSIQVSIVGVCWNNWRLPLVLLCPISIVACIEL